MDATTESSVVQVLNNFVVMRTMCSYIDDVKRFRLVNPICNEAVVSYYGKIGRRPLIEFRDDADIAKFMTDMRNRLPGLSSISSYHVKLHYNFQPHYTRQTNPTWISTPRLNQFLEMFHDIVPEISVQIKGRTAPSQVPLPQLPNLQVLNIRTNLDRPVPGLRPFVMGQFPALHTLTLTGRNVLKSLFAGTTLPSVKTLILDMALRIREHGHVDEAASTDNIHLLFPNLKRLELRNRVYVNFERVNYVLTKVTGLEELILNTDQSTLNNGRNNFAATFAGGRLPRMSKIRLAQMCEDLVPGKATVPGSDGFYSVPSLANMKFLKRLDITISHVGQLRVLMFMSRPNLLPALQALNVNFPARNPIQAEFKDDYLKVLRRYHHTVRFQENPPKYTYLL